MDHAPLLRDDLKEILFLIAGLFFLLQGGVYLGNAMVLTTFERPCQVSLGCINGLSAETALDWGLGAAYALVGLLFLFWAIRIIRRNRPPVAA